MNIWQKLVLALGSILIMIRLFFPITYQAWQGDKLHPEAKMVGKFLTSEIDLQANSIQVLAIGIGTLAGILLLKKQAQK